MSRHGRLPSAPSLLLTLSLLASFLLVACAALPPDTPPEDLPDVEAEAAEAFLAAEPYFDAFVSITLPPAMPPDADGVKAVLKGWLDEKSRALTEARDAYKTVLDLHDPFWTVAAMCRIGEAYAHYAAALDAAPTPTVVRYELDMTRFKGVPPDMLAEALADAGLKDRLVDVVDGLYKMEHDFTPEEAAEYHEALVDLATPFVAKARGTFLAALVFARDRGVVSEHEARCAAGLAALPPEPPGTPPRDRERTRGGD